MDVHHHAHTSRKKWTHYFWEFLMLFLAVFCGFLAEYQLEHKIEKDRERQYMASLVEDLRLDTADIRVEYELALWQKGLADSVISTSNKDVLTPEDVKSLYLLSINSTRVVKVVFQNRTSSQLKNSGSMRLIRNKIAADSILSYWHAVEICDAVAARLDYIAEERGNIYARLFHNKYIIRPDSALANAVAIKEGATLMSKDPALIAEYSNRTYSRKAILQNYLFIMKQTEASAVRLIELIQKEYHLD